MEKTLDELKVLCQRSLFEWFRCWGFTDSSSLSEFMFSIRLSFWFPSPLFCCLFHLFLVVHHREQLVLLSFFFLINNSSLFTYQKKGKKNWKIQKQCEFVYTGTCVPWMAIETRIRKFVSFVAWISIFMHNLTLWALWLFVWLKKYELIILTPNYVTHFDGNNYKNPKRKA